MEIESLPIKGRVYDMKSLLLFKKESPRLYWWERNWPNM